MDSLSEMPQTHSDLEKPPVPDDGDEIALKVDKPEDITEQQGQDQDVHNPDDGTEGIKITDRGRIEFPNAGNANGDAGTISFRIKPEWAGADHTDNALVQIRNENEWNNRLELVKNGEFLRFIITDDTGKEADISTRITNWQNLEEHDVTATWGDGRTTLYIDGQVVGQNEYSGNLRFAEGTPMFLGADWRGSAYAGANATLNGFTLSTTPSHP
ncbi:MAG: LamG-like jellyroll fold domain-containing protein [Candidatus Binatia bacterium]